MGTSSICDWSRKYLEKKDLVQLTNVFHVPFLNICSSLMQIKILVAFHILDVTNEKLGKLNYRLFTFDMSIVLYI